MSAVIDLRRKAARRMRIALGVAAFGALFALFLIALALRALWRFS